MSNRNMSATVIESWLDWQAFSFLPHQSAHRLLLCSLDGESEEEKTLANKTSRETVLCLARGQSHRACVGIWTVIIQHIQATWLSLKLLMKDSSPAVVVFYFYFNNNKNVCLFLNCLPFLGGVGVGVGGGGSVSSSLTLV